MKEEVKQRLVEALRSGKYRQGRSYLKQSPLPQDSDPRDEYCVLGVLAEVCGGTWEKSGPRREYSLNGETLAASLLDADTTEISGLSPSNQVRNGTMNDEGEPFAEIADLIEKEQ